MITKSRRPVVIDIRPGSMVQFLSRNGQFIITGRAVLPLQGTTRWNVETTTCYDIQHTSHSDMCPELHCPESRHLTVIEG